MHRQALKHIFLLTFNIIEDPVSASRILKEARLIILPLTESHSLSLCAMKKAS